LIWLLFAFIPAVVAHTKGAQGTRIAFLLGLLLGPFGLLWVIAVGSGVKCPECRSNVPVGATRCRRCTAIITPVKEQPQSDKAQSMSDKDALRAKLDRFRAERAKTQS
jgi:hypothetical protein